MEPITITAEHSYKILFGVDWREELRKISSAHEKVLVLIPAPLHEIFGINNLGLNNLRIIQTPDGETAKTQEFLSKVWFECGDFGLTRSDCIVGIGGGSTTDLAGFAAASWLRGIAWHAIPTTLAGMVDAAIGGKTGINSDHGKNLIGAFHSPVSVVVDTSFLKTLSPRDFSAGMAEVIKAGFIADPKILDLVLSVSENTDEIIWRSVKVKADVVSVDFKESRLREILNYGHTLGHAIEKNENYELRHGEAVSIGLIFAAELSNILDKLSKTNVEKHRELLSHFNLPISYKPGAFPRLLEIMAGDKKSRGSNLRFIGIAKIGEPIWLETVTSDQLMQAYERITP